LAKIFQLDPARVAKKAGDPPELLVDLGVGVGLTIGVTRIRRARVLAAPGQSSAASPAKR